MWFNTKFEDYRHTNLPCPFLITFQWFTNEAVDVNSSKKLTN